MSDANESGETERKAAALKAAALTDEQLKKNNLRRILSRIAAIPTRGESKAPELQPVIGPDYYKKIAPFLWEDSEFEMIDGVRSLTLKIPNITNCDELQNEAIQIPTLAFILKEGVMVATDSLASMGGNISSQSVKKTIEINPFLLGTMARGVVDCQFWYKKLRERCQLYEEAYKERITVTFASDILENIINLHRHAGLSLAIMIAGWDEKGPGLWLVDNEFARIKVDCLCMASGKLCVNEVLKDGYRSDLSVEEAEELARRSFYHATSRDGASGGVASVYYVGPKGWQKLSGDDVEKLHPVEAAAAVGEHEMSDGPIA